MIQRSTKSSTPITLEEVANSIAARMTILLQGLLLLYAGITLSLTLNCEDTNEKACDVPSPFYEEPLLRFGDEIYDQCGETILKNEQNAIELNETYYFYQEGYRNLCISKQGTVSFGKTCTDTCVSSSSSNPNFIAGFCDDEDSISYATFHYKELSCDIYDTKRFCESKGIIMKHLMHKFGSNVDNFNLTHILVLTWLNVSRLEDTSEKVTFQIVLVTESNSSETYVLLLYKEIGWDNVDRVEVGFRHGCQTYDLPFNKSELGNESNVDSNGVYVYRIDFINAAESLALNFIHDTPHVSEKKLRVNFMANRPNVSMNCSFGKMTMNCSSGCFSHTFNNVEIRKHGVKRYILSINATDRNTNENVTLKGKFRVFGNQEKYFCSGNMINTGTQPIQREGYVEYASLGKTSNFTHLMEQRVELCGNITSQINGRSIYRMNITDLMLPPTVNTSRLVLEPGGCKYSFCRRKIGYLLKFEV